MDQIKTLIGELIINNLSLQDQVKQLQTRITELEKEKADLNKETPSEG